MRIKQTLSLMALLVCFNIQSYAQDHNTLDSLNTNRNQRPITEDTTLPKGSTITTTINAATQYTVDSLLRQSMEKYDAVSGTAMVIETQTGKIVAMSNLGQNSDGDYCEDFNYAIADNVEQGQLFTLVPLITLLENNAVSLDTIIDAKGGVVNINGVRVSDAHIGTYSGISLRECFAYSSNVGFASFVDKYYRDRPEEFIASIRKLGITDASGFQLKGDREPFIKNTTDKNWSKVDLVTMSYGYGVEFTALRMLMLYNAVANNGKLITPYILKEIRDDKGDLLMSFNAKVLNGKICSDNTLDQLKIALEDIQYNESIKELFNDRDYTIAGKLGTSIVNVNGQYISNEGRQYLTSFVGYFPADNPKYSCIVQMQTFRSNSDTQPYQGDTLAAPVFRGIADCMMMSLDDK